MVWSVSVLCLLNLVYIGQTPPVDGSWISNDTHIANMTTDWQIHQASALLNDSEMKTINENFSHLGDNRDVFGRKDNSSVDMESDVLGIINQGRVSQSTFESIEYSLNIAPLPVFIVLGLCGNIAVLRTLLNERPRYPVTIYLIYLSIADSFVMVSFVLPWLAYLVTLYNQPLGMELQAALFIPVTSMLKSISRKSTAFITVILSIERTIAVKCPLLVKTTFLNQHPRKVLAAMLVFLLIFFLPNIFYYDVTVLPNTETNESMLVIQMTKFAIALSKPHGLALMVVIRILPMISVFVCNVIIINEVQKSQNNRKQIASNSQEGSSVTRLLLTISMIFLICTTPATIMTGLFSFMGNFGWNQREHYLFLTVKMISDFMDVINSSVNFIVYMLVGKKFREKFVQTWRCARG